MTRFRITRLPCGRWPWELRDTQHPERVQMFATHQEAIAAADILARGGGDRMIGPKRPKQTDTEKREAYELATLRDMGSCQMPGLHAGAVQRDHRQNRDPFNTLVENLQLLCAGHHEWKTRNPEQACREGWGVPSWADPLLWPARRVVAGRLEWVLYLRATEYSGSESGWIVIDEVRAAALRAGLTADRVA